TIPDPSPLAAPGPVLAIQGINTGTISVAMFTDPGGPEALADYSATINWGDSTSNPGTIVLGADNKTFSVQGSHTYGVTSAIIMVTITHDNAQPVTVNDPVTFGDAVYLLNPTVAGELTMQQNA